MCICSESDCTVKHVCHFMLAVQFSMSVISMSVTLCWLYSSICLSLVCLSLYVGCTVQYVCHQHVCHFMLAVQLCMSGTLFGLFSSVCVTLCGLYNSVCLSLYVGCTARYVCHVVWAVQLVRLLLCVGCTVQYVCHFVWAVQFSVSVTLCRLYS